MKINTEIIKALNPCQDRLDNWMQYYPKFNGDVSKFFKLEHITHQDKLWVGLRLVNDDTKIIFALDCSFSSDAAAYAADAAYAAAYAASYAAAANAARKVEQENQLDVLLYLIKEG